jgi:hypothetical protein
MILAMSWSTGGILGRSSRVSAAAAIFWAWRRLGQGANSLPSDQSGPTRPLMSTVDATFQAPQANIGTPKLTKEVRGLRHPPRQARLDAYQRPAWTAERRWLTADIMPWMAVLP